MSISESSSACGIVPSATTTTTCEWRCGSAARKAGAPLALAAAATAVGFFSFLPTNYRGLSELGMIAGCGMLIAFLCSITLVPAMLAVLNPPAEPAPVGFSRLAPLDDLLQRHRVAVIAATVIAVLAGVPLLFAPAVRFQSRQSAKSGERIGQNLSRIAEHSSTPAAMMPKYSHPRSSEADTLAKRLENLPEVSRTLTLSNFIPRDQDEKIAAIKSAAQGSARRGQIRSSSNPRQATDEVIASIRAGAEDLSRAAGNKTGPGADAARNVSEVAGTPCWIGCRHPRQGRGRIHSTAAP